MADQNAARPEDAGERCEGMEETTQTRNYDRPFADIRVVDMSQGLAGPACGMLLAAHGASVVKIEPEKGDWSRGMGTRHGPHSALEMAVNRGKRSIALDLKSPDGVAVLHRLFEDTDVVIESFRPGVADKLGVGYESVRKINPRTLYVSISGFGQQGPYAERSSTDMVGQAFSGMMSINRDEAGTPFKIGYIPVDTSTSMYAFQAVSTSLYARGDEGRLIDVSLMQSAAAMIAPKIIESYLEGTAPRPLNAPGGSYQTSDGWIAITLMREEQYQAICKAIGLPELATDPRFDNPEKRADALDQLAPMIREVILTRATDEWIERLTAADVLCNPINEITDWLGDPHVQAVDAAPLLAQNGVGAVPVPRIPGMTDAAFANLSPATPAIGEHGRQILAEIGYSADRIEAMIASGVLHLAQSDSALAG